MRFPRANWRTVLTWCVVFAVGLTALAAMRKANRQAVQLRELAARLDALVYQPGRQELLEQERLNDRLLLRVLHLPWATSEDGQLALRLVSSQDAYHHPGRPVVVMSELRNASPQRITVWQVDDAGVMGAVGPSGPLPYRGPDKSRSAPTPVILDPGHVSRSTFTLDDGSWPGIDAPGEYAITLRYVSPNSRKDDPPAWIEAPPARATRLR